MFEKMNITTTRHGECRRGFSPAGESWEFCGSDRESTTNQGDRQMSVSGNRVIDIRAARRDGYLESPAQTETPVGGCSRHGSNRSPNREAAWETLFWM